MALLIQPTPDMRVFIRQELREPESPDAIEKDVATIREWLSRQPHLPKDIDDQRLRTFLRGCKFSIEKVKKKLDMFYTMRTAVPEFFVDRDVTRPELSDILDKCHIPVLPGVTPNGRRIHVMRGLDKDVETPNFADCVKLALMIGDIRLKEEQTGVAGDVYLFDASVVTAAHFAKISPTLVKKFLICVQEAYPVKVKEVHIINISPLVNTIMDFVRPFLKEKIRQRIHFHSNLESLYKFVPKEMLPKEYGGNAGTTEELNNQWRNKMKEYTAWFKEQESSKTNEALRPGSPKTADDLFGLDGTFRKLTID